MTSFSYSANHPYKALISEGYKTYLEMRTKPKTERYKYFPSEPGFTDGFCPGFASVFLIAKKLGLTYELPSNMNLASGLAALIAKGEVN